METADNNLRAQVAAELRAAVSASGMPASRFASYLGTSGSRLSTYLNGKTTPSAVTYLRADRLGKTFAEIRARQWPTPDDTARETGRAVDRHFHDRDPVDWPLRTALLGRDTLRAALAERSLATIAWETIAPITTGHSEWDALIAALTAHEFEAAGLTAPEWTHDRQLEKPWTPTHPWLAADQVRDRTPEWLSRFGIYMPERDLATA